MIASCTEAFMPLIIIIKRVEIKPKENNQCQVHCGMLYQLFERQMGKEMLDPHASFPQCRLVDIFCKSTEKLVKDTILHQFTMVHQGIKLV